MTLPYEMRRIPAKLAVTCPACQREAQFEFATLALINRKKDVDWFKTNDAFEYVKAQTGGGGGYQHHALYYPNLHPGRLSAIDDWPEGYSPANWTRRSDWIYTRQSLGAIACPHCGFKEKKLLDWPNDAWFQIQYRNQTLWAFNRDMTAVLADYIADTNRSREGRRYRTFLMTIPKPFLAAKARDTVVKRLKARLAA